MIDRDNPPYIMSHACPGQLCVPVYQACTVEETVDRNLRPYEFYTIVDMSYVPYTETELAVLSSQYGKQVVQFENQMFI